MRVACPLRGNFKNIEDKRRLIPVRLPFPRNFGHPAWVHSRGKRRIDQGGLRRQREGAATSQWKRDVKLEER